MSLYLVKQPRCKEWGVQILKTYSAPDVDVPCLVMNRPLPPPESRCSNRKVSRYLLDGSKFSIWNMTSVSVASPWLTLKDLPVSRSQASQFSIVWLFACKRTVVVSLATVKSHDMLPQILKSEGFSW